MIPNLFRNNSLDLPKSFFWLGLLFIIVGIPLSKAMMSIGNGVILFSVILLAIKKRCVIDKEEVKFQVIPILLVFLLLIVSLLYSNDYSYALRDLKVKLPLVILPIAFLAFKEDVNNFFHFIIRVFLISLLISCAWSTIVALGFLEVNIVDNRGLSRFISHIRYSIALLIGVVFSVYLWAIESKRYILVIAGILLVFVVYLQSMSGVFLGTVVLGIVLFYLIFSKKTTNLGKLFAWLILVVGIVGIIIVVKSFFIFKNDQLLKDAHRLTITEHGEEYAHRDDLASMVIMENGFRVYDNVAFNEVRDTWKTISYMEIEGKDLKGNRLESTILHYMTSKGLPKDRKHLLALSTKEIQAMESGVSNVRLYNASFFQLRLFELFSEYQKYQQQNDPNDKSIAMRLIFWETGFRLIQANPILGVGVGDVQVAFNKYYEENNSILRQENRLRAHNQYMTFWIGAGIFAFIAFLVYIILPFLHYRAYRSLPFLLIYVILLLSLLFEDGLETQAGVTIFAMFYNLILAKKVK